MSDGKTLHERRVGTPFHGPVIPFVEVVEYHPISAKDLSRLHEFGLKVSPIVFLGYVLYAGGIWRADIEELEQMDASALQAIRLNAKEVLTPMKGDNFIIPSRRWNSKKISGGDQRLRTSTLIRDRPERGVEQEVLRGESDGLSSPTPLQDDSTRDDAEAKKASGLLREISFIVITLNTEPNCSCREKNHFLLH